MRVLLGLAALALLLPALAGAQLPALDRERGIPAGLSLPTLGVAAADEPIGQAVTPAAIGFQGGLTLQYFHEGVPSRNASGDGVYLADRFGPLAVGWDLEWLRPGDAPLARYRRSRLALALSDGRSVSLGGGWGWIQSQDAALDRADGWDLGLTLRPFRFLSVGASALGSGARIGPTPLPARFDMGVAARLVDDRLTASADLLADDRGQAFRTTAVRLGAGLSVVPGLVARFQVDLPVRRDPAADRAGRPDGFLTLTFDAPHAGATAGATRFDERGGWIAGVRLSQERYPAGGNGRGLSTLQLPKDLEPERLLWFTVGDRDPYAQLLERLVAARDDPEVGAILLRVDTIPLGSGRVEELRALVASIRERKPVLAYLTGGGTREYWLSSAATAVAAPPGAPLMVNGFASSRLYYRDLLARLGVVVQVVRAGAYKSATEPLVRSGSSPEARQMTDAILDDVYGRFLSDVAAARKLPAERVRALVDEGLFTGEQARAAGLVDAVVWPDELEGWADRVAGKRLHRAGRYRPEPLRPAQRWGRAPAVEIVRLAGIIARGGSDLLGGEQLAGAEAVAAALHRAADDPEVRAIVLRVESPGGDGFASDLIWREAVLARQKGKPVIASMGDLAASGGYLVAAAADAIVAEPSTLTGSIGVFAAKPDLGGLLERLDVHREASARGERAQLLSLLRPWGPAEESAVQKQVDAFYELFLDRVAEGRHLTRAEVEAVASGRVWTGQQALERRLVDRIGSLADAVAMALEAAGLSARDGVVVRRAEAQGGADRVGLGALARPAPEPGLSQLLRAAPELEAALLLGQGGLGPVLALPDEWLGP